MNTKIFTTLSTLLAAATLSGAAVAQESVGAAIQQQSPQTASSPDPESVSDSDENLNFPIDFGLAPADSIDLRYAEMLRERDLDEIISSLTPDPAISLPYNKLLGPWIFSGFRVHPSHNFTPAAWTFNSCENTVTLPSYPDYPEYGYHITDTEEQSYGIESGIPDWIRNSMVAERIQDNAMYYMMMRYPHLIEYAYWDLPVPPSLPDDDVSFENYIRDLDLPDVNVKDAIIPEFKIQKTHWLHTTGASLQFSQAYVSSNWYQGGTDYLALLVNLGWNVQLNPAYHPNLLFESNLSYKLGLNQTPTDEYHKYSISEDLFQYNLKAGLKALKRWYYSFNMQFKTQMFNTYESNSPNRKAAFLSPGDFNMGIGMTYSYNNKRKTFKLNASIAPVSYNLKTCIDPLINPTQFNIEPGRKTNSEIGSNGEVTMEWFMASNIKCKSRLFLFTDYSYFQGDLETTFNFDINRFLSTQLYVHLRYDSLSEAMMSRWRHWMLKEILSFGLSYRFSTKPS